MDDLSLVNPQPETLCATFRLRWMGHELEAQVEVPTAPVRPRILLTLVQNLTNSLVELGVQGVQANGETVSCQVGCAACCRQLIPVTQSEAYYLRDLVEAMPEPRRSMVKARFADALRQVHEAGLLVRLREESPQDDWMEFGLEYIQHSIACPFLDQEKCSIYPDRPLSCREYLVTSPAENCRNPTRETIRTVPTPGQVMPAFGGLDSEQSPEPGQTPWVPIVLALEWTAANPEPPATKTGPELFTRFMRDFTTKQLPQPGWRPVQSEVTPK